MAIDTKDLIELVIRPTLDGLALDNNSDAEQMLVGTCAQESLMGTYLKQMEGPALGIYDMQRDDHDDIYNNFLNNMLTLKSRILVVCGMQPFHDRAIPPAETMIYNLRYATAMARVHYFRIKEVLPAAGYTVAQAAYWKRYYNSATGKGDEAAFLNNWERFAKKYYDTAKS